MCFFFATARDVDGGAEKGSKFHLYSFLQFNDFLYEKLFH